MNADTVTTAEQRAQMEVAIARGETVSGDDVIDLISDADLAEQLCELIDAIHEALERDGKKLIDVTDDRDEAPQFMFSGIDAGDE